MSEKNIITGISIEEQKLKAKKILEAEVIPKEKIFQARKDAGELSEELLAALKNNL